MVCIDMDPKKSLTERLLYGPAPSIDELRKMVNKDNDLKMKATFFGMVHSAEAVNKQILELKTRPPPPRFESPSLPETPSPSTTIATMSAGGGDLAPEQSETG